MAKDPGIDARLKVLGGDTRSLSEFMTTFLLASVVIDPFTNESAWILPTAVRVLRNFSGADVRVNFVVTGTDDDAREFLGPYATEFLVFTDADRSFVQRCGLERLPAFLFIRTDGTLGALAEGWSPQSWRKVADAIAVDTAWSRPQLPVAGDPAPFIGSPAAA